MKKENMLAAMIFGGSGSGGGGGGSSSVLDVVCTVTETDGVASYDYSVSAQDAVAAVNAGKAIRLMVRGWGSFDAYYPTINMRISQTSLSFVIVSGQSQNTRADFAVTHILNTETPGWSQIPNEHSMCHLIIGDDEVREKYAVPLMTIDNALALYTITQILPFNGSVVQLVLAATSNAGTAVGLTIVDIDTLYTLKYALKVIKENEDHGRPCKITDRYNNSSFDFNIISVEYGLGQSAMLVTSITMVTSFINSGNLCNVTVTVSVTYDLNDDISQAQAAAYCDSHAITFM